MVGKGVVESVLRVLDAVRGGGAEALPVQQAACETLNNLSDLVDNRVRWLFACRSAPMGCRRWFAPGETQRVADIPLA